MRKVLFALFLASACSSALADWEPVGTSDTDVLYANRSTIRKAGHVVKMWDLLDLKTATAKGATGKKALSQKTQSEYDCKNERSRSLYRAMHEGAMGAGERVLFDNKPSEWEPVPPQSGVEVLWKIACGRK